VDRGQKDTPAERVHLPRRERPRNRREPYYPHLYRVKFDGSELSLPRTRGIGTKAKLDKAGFFQTSTMSPSRSTSW